MSTPGQVEAEYVSLCEMLLDCSIDRVMAIDPLWKIIAFNNTYERYTGLKKQDVIGRHILEVFPEIGSDLEMLDGYKHALSGMKSFLPSSTGKFNRHYVENHFIPLKKEDDKMFGVMNIMHDVAHRIKVEKQLVVLNKELERRFEQLHEANQDLATFTYVAGTEIQDPIKSVYTALEILGRNEGSNLSNGSRASLRKMQASLNRVHLLLGDILTISKISQHGIYDQPVDLNALLERVQGDIANKLRDKAVDITTQRLPTVKGSAEMLTYLFIQLIDNAIKFQRPDRSTIVDITCETVSTREGLRKSMPYYKISVTDNGVGISPDDTGRIFQMFESIETNTFKGSGIGLALCRKIMEQHDGMITADSTRELGTTITCYFPVPPRNDQLGF